MLNLTYNIDYKLYDFIDSEEAQRFLEDKISQINLERKEYDINN